MDAGERQRQLDSSPEPEDETITSGNYESGMAIMPGTTGWLPYWARISDIEDEDDVDSPASFDEPVRFGQLWGAILEDYVAPN
jgi:hypothetical protein